MAKIERRQFTDDFKTKAVTHIVQQVRDKKHVTIKVEAIKFGVVETVLRKWVRDPRFGGDSTLFRKTNKKSKEVLTSLPTNRRGSQRAKALVAVRWICPHCAGAITTRE